MAITDTASALAQYQANLSWQNSIASAQLALEAVRYLLVARAQHMSDSQTQFSYQDLASEKRALEKFLGATVPRSFGRSRRVGASFRSGGIG